RIPPPSSDSFLPTPPRRDLTLRGWAGVANIRPHGTGDGPRTTSELAPLITTPSARRRAPRNGMRGAPASQGWGCRASWGRGGAGMSTSRAQKDQVKVHIRWMIRRDMPEVLHTEQESFEFSWTEEDFLKCLRQRNCIGMVAEHNEKVVGFMIYELHKTKLHVLNFAVHPSCRRIGIGRQMVSKLIGKLSSHRRTKITLAVR